MLISSSKVVNTWNLTFVDPCIIVPYVRKNPTMYPYFHYSIFIWSSTCFRRHTAHHREPRTALAASGFSHVEGCWTCSWWTLSGTVCLTTSTNYMSTTTFHVWKTRGCQCSFRLPMMGGVSPETRWASYKYGIIKLLIHCCILLDFSLWMTWNLVSQLSVNYKSCHKMLNMYLSQIICLNKQHVSSNVHVVNYVSCRTWSPPTPPQLIPFLLT